MNLRNGQTNCSHGFCTFCRVLYFVEQPCLGICFCILIKALMEKQTTNVPRYERELEVEREVEKEVERQLPSVSPRAEEDWEISRLLSASNTGALGIEVLNVPMMLASTMRLQTIKAWPDRAIFATKNFHHALKTTKHRFNLDDYLRPVDALIVFPKSHEVLLLSEREADFALDLFRTATSCNFFMNFVLWRNSFQTSMLPGLLPHGRPTAVLRDASRLVSVQCFMGDTRFKEGAQKESLRSLVRFLEAGWCELIYFLDLFNSFHLLCFVLFFLLRMIIPTNYRLVFLGLKPLLGMINPINQHIQQGLKTATRKNMVEEPVASRI